ncbi:MAG: glucose-1-phosphate adenylyltransferase subunit GlgD [Candidatus Enterenecus sp.]
MNMMGIIFAEMYGNQLDSLTYDRNMAAIPFGGRYRLVDFILSNMVNSGISNVGVLAKQHYRSLMDHLSSGQEWDLNRKNGGLHILPPYANESISHSTVGKLDELRNALDLMRGSTETYVLLADADVVCNIDLRPALASHIASGCEITAVTIPADGSCAEPHDVVIQMEDGQPKAFALNYVAKAGDQIGMSMYIVNRERLAKLVREYTSFGAFHLERDFIQQRFNQGELSINVYPFDGDVYFIHNMADYLRASLAITDEAASARLFRPESPIYTRVHDEVPSYYGMDCTVSGSIIADGCIIEGSAQHSVLSRGVRIAKGARIKDCIIMQGSVVGEGAVLENVVVDKHAVISAGTQLKGLPSAPVTIRKGATI